MMSSRKRVRKHFQIYLLNCKSLGHETWPTNTYSHGQYFK